MRMGIPGIGWRWSLADRASNSNKTLSASGLQILLCQICRSWYLRLLPLLERAAQTSQQRQLGEGVASPEVLFAKKPLTHLNLLNQLHALSRKWRGRSND